MWPKATSIGRCRRWAARWARPRCWRCASASPTSTPAARWMAVEEFVDADNWPALLPSAGRCGHRRLRPGARQGRDGRLGAGRTRSPSSRSARPAVSACAARRRGGPSQRHARPAAGVAAPAAAPRARRGAAGAHRAALRVLARAGGRADAMRVMSMTATAAASTATATVPCVQSPPPSAWWPPVRQSRNCCRGPRPGR